jgi:hypothetical protein
MESGIGSQFREPFLKRKITKTAYAKPSAQALLAAINTLINGSICKY